MSPVKLFLVIPLIGFGGERRPFAAASYWRAALIAVEALKARAPASVASST